MASDKTIVYTCPYVPPEWIAAHGLQPRRLIPQPAEGALVLPRLEGLCPYARAFINDVAVCKDVGGVVVTTMCDQMRRVFDLLVRRADMPAFLLNVPSTWQTVAAPRLYLDELKRLGRFLVRLGGHEPGKEDLVQAMLTQRGRETAWQPQAQLGDGLPWERGSAHNRGRTIPKAFGLEAATQNTPTFDTGSQAEGDGVHSTPYNHGVSLALVGGPLMQRDRVLFEIVQDCGGRIVLDASETGQRGRPASFDRRRLVEDPLVELAEAYFRIPDAGRRPNSELYRWLQEQLERTGARGILFHHYVWCDKWHAEFQRLKDWTRLPVLRLDSEGEGEVEMVRVRNRVRAFLETLA